MILCIHSILADKSDEVKPDRIDRLPMLIAFTQFSDDLQDESIWRWLHLSNRNGLFNLEDLGYEIIHIIAIHQHKTINQSLWVETKCTEVGHGMA